MPNLKYFQKDLSVRPSRINGAGLGLFANKFIPKGTRLGWYRGDHISRQDWIDSENDDYMWMLVDDYENDYYVDGRPQVRNNKLRYVNGCQTPGQVFSVNVIAYQKDDRIWYKTCRKIHEGEELIVDYGGDYWDPVSVE